VGFSAESSRIQLISTILLIAGIAAACRFGARFGARSAATSADLEADAADEGSRGSSAAHAPK
ncbi:MAG: hypothetical protein QOH40_539, partial [Arthrobacter pascens]|nr:hypothetical protein [Arthrobacter pascens]